MSDRPPPPGPEERPPQPASGGGPAIGFFLTLLLAGAGFFLGLRSPVAFGLIAPILLIALSWIFLGRHIPGYGRGAAWALAVIAIVFTACIAILSASFSGS